MAGGFGSVRIGAINSGRYSYGWNTDSPQVGVPINSGWVSVFVAPLNNSFRFRSVGVSTVIDASNDEQKITYFTPRFSGFQFTASWTPAADAVNDFSVGLGGENTGPVDTTLFYTDGWDLGFSYLGGWDDIRVNLQGGVAGANAPENVPIPAAFAGIRNEVNDYRAYKERTRMLVPLPKSGAGEPAREGDDPASNGDQTAV